MAQAVLTALRKSRQYAFDTPAHFVHRSALVCHPSVMSFAVSAELFENAVVLTVLGDVDLATAPALDSAIAASWSPPARLVIDASRIAFMDSTGLGVLVKAAIRAREEGSKVAMAAVCSRVLKVLTITGLDAHLPIYDTVSDALRNTE
ncbi:MAG TPA: anti-anti-sigma factor [Actinobacteria bacterium]|nr:anti-anti-sigma factor [Actinomycetota bacterium]